MPTSVWSTQQLAEFLGAVSVCETEASAALTAVERAAEALEAEVAAIVCGGEIVAAVGYPEGAAPAGELMTVAKDGGELVVPGGRTYLATRVALEQPPGGILVLGRSALLALRLPLMTGYSHRIMPYRCLRIILECYPWKDSGWPE